MKNIVLIGMPSCGKSTVGKALARLTGKLFFDSDEEIVKKIGCSISCFFASKGEAEFRKIESEVLKELSQKENIILATGGGAVIKKIDAEGNCIVNEENVSALKKNGVIVFIDRDIRKLTPTADRPLLQNKKMLRDLFEKRYERYVEACDIKIDGNGTASQVREKLMHAVQKFGICTEAVFKPSELSGTVTAPPSKSAFHRVLICRALSGKDASTSLGMTNGLLGMTTGVLGMTNGSIGMTSDDSDMINSVAEMMGVSKINISEDILAMTECLSAFSSSGLPIFNCRESGNTLRFMIPIALAKTGGGIFTGTKKLFERGIGVYEKVLGEKGIKFETVSELFRPHGEQAGTGESAPHGEQTRGTQSHAENFAVKITGKLTSGSFELPGNVSSQYISGLLFALPLLDGESILKITPPVESLPYIKMTVDILQKFGIEITKIKPAENCEDEMNSKCTEGLVFKIKGNQKYIPSDTEVEGDWSNAAFFYALKALGNKIEIKGLKSDSLQGDKACVEDFEKLCAPPENASSQNSMHRTENAPAPNSASGEIVIDVSQTIDLAPVLFAVAAANYGGTFTGTERLKIKESDRANAMAEELSKFGIETEISENKVVIKNTKSEPKKIEPQKLVSPKETLFGHNDHRIVMALSVLLCKTGGTIKGIEAVNKTFPNFFTELKKLGAQIEIR